MKGKKPLRLVLGILTLAVMGLIFAFSMETGAQSSETSGRMVRFLLTRLYPAYEELPLARQDELFALGQTIVRKGAHFSIYACLGCLLRLLFAQYPVRYPALLALLGAVIYACTDEIHQLFVPNRAGMAQDVLLDGAGAACGIWLVSTICRWQKNAKESTKRQCKKTWRDKA